MKKPKPYFFWSYKPRESSELWFGVFSGETKKNRRVLILDVRLMEIEKRRLGFPSDMLVFIGMENFAEYYWCAWQTFLRSKKDEFRYFSAYFEDRFHCLLASGKNKLVGKTPLQILKILSRFSFEDAEMLFEKNKVFPKSPTRTKKVRLEIEINNTKDPLRRGELAETIYSEKYPRFRWNFRFGDFVLIGIPDGIGKDFVYEFKSTKIPNSLMYKLREARTQADLYGYFFKKPKKIVHSFCNTNKASERHKEDVNKKTTFELLERWTKMVDGELPLMPLPWKCRSCEFRKACKLKKMADEKKAEEEQIKKMQEKMKNQTQISEWI